jgi:fermentation-respiration switch protein FrsA (DUF1100 family)
MTRARLTVVSLIAALSVVAATTAACSGSSSPPTPPPPVPDHDHFYDPPKNLASLHPGEVIRTRAVTLASIDKTKLAKAETVLYVSTDIHGKNIAASETVLTPTANWSGDARPLLAIQPPYDSLGTECEPSYTLRISGNPTDETVSALNNLLPSGVEIVIPDYEGPDALFAIGDQEGRTVLDGVKAAEATGAGGISQGTKVAAWGYSGGALASAWSAELQPSYAAGINLVGVAEGGVPADIKASLETLDGTKGAFLAIMTLVAIERAYPHAGLAAALTAPAKTLFSDIAASCGGTRLLAKLSGTALNSLVTTPTLLNLPSLQPVFAALKLGHHPPTAPIYNYQGTADEIVGFTPDRDLVRYYCSNNVTVDFAPIEGADHVEAYLKGSNGVVSWLRDRLVGAPAPDNCSG